MKNLSHSLLRQARRNCRLTLQEVADFIGVSEPTMWKYENGKLPITSRRLFQLLNLYNCSIENVVIEVQNENL